MSDALLHDEKRFSERFFALMGDPQLRAVLEKFGVEPFRRSSVVEGFDDFLRSHDFTGRRCLEIGSWMGLTAIVLARYFEEVVSIDIHPNQTKHDIVEFLGVKNIRFIDIPDNSHKAKLIDSLEFEAAYVDGDHAKDTFTDFALVERCGHVLFHEVWEPQPSVMKLVRRLRTRGETVRVRNKLGVWKR